MSIIPTAKTYSDLGIEFNEEIKALKMTKDTFRKVYRPLKEENTVLIQAIKTKCDELEELMDKIASREMSLAKTNLEQASMWATKAVVLDDEKTPEAA